MFILSFFVCLFVLVDCDIFFRRKRIIVAVLIFLFTNSMNFVKLYISVYLKNIGDEFENEQITVRNAAKISAGS